MGKRSKRFEEKDQFVDCAICDGVVPMEFYMARGDMVCCDECGAEYIIKARNPIRLLLLEEEFDLEDDDDDYFLQPDYEDLFDGRGYD